MANEKIKCSDITCQCGSQVMKVQSVHTFKDGMLEPIRTSYSVVCAGCGKRVQMITGNNFIVYGR